MSLRSEIHSIDYLADSAVTMRRLSTLPMPAFLDSANAKIGDARFDLLTALPVASVEVCGGSVTCSDPTIELSSDIFGLVQQLVDRYKPPAAELATLKQKISALPFFGGAIGYLAYPTPLDKPIDESSVNSGASLSHAQKNSLRIDNAHFGIYQWVLAIDHSARHSHLVFLSSCPDSTRRQVLKALALNKPPKLSSFQLTQAFNNDISLEQYRQAFEAIKNYIYAGDCYQVNLTQRFSASFQGSPLRAYLRLREVSKSPFSAYLAWSDKALLSLSPERFIKHRQGCVITQPIKGTRPRGAEPSSDLELSRELLNSEKDKAENLMIVDLLRNDLGQLCKLGSVKVKSLFELQSFNNVHHLVSTIEAELETSTSPLELLSSCFPGGSITGAPKRRAMQIIAELESHPRNSYCGTVLYLGFDGAMDSNITIRSLFCQQQNIVCSAGGGIVADSDCDAEYQECFNKIDLLINTLQDIPR